MFWKSCTTLHVNAIALYLTYLNVRCDLKRETDNCGLHHLPCSQISVTRCHISTYLIFIARHLHHFALQLFMYRIAVSGK